MKTITFSCLLILVFVINANAQQSPFLKYPATEHRTFNFQQTNTQLYANKLSISKYAHATDEDVDVDKKIRKGKRQKSAGITLMCLGGIFAAGAIATGIISTKDANSDLTTKNLALRGAALGGGALGAVFLGIGLPLTIAGTHKVRKYGR